ncbi:uncharacterized protein LOC143151582 isoform X1 [Ptiloglossa arizonensis]|uniref:uncharacterized protein LOC143151582 isoform X1 n=1 Tax=Ptiloglossa arizonensis TaxID=3350558 RepID=UPI003F9FF60A
MARVARNWKEKSVAIGIGVREPRGKSSPGGYPRPEVLVKIPEGPRSTIPLGVGTIKGSRRVDEAARRRDARVVVRPEIRDTELAAAIGNGTPWKSCSKLDEDTVKDTPW